MATHYQNMLKDQIKQKLDEILEFQRVIPDYNRRITNQAYSTVVDNADSLAMQLMHLSQ